jgi:non-ribosomal peptide synthetase component F
VRGIPATLPDPPFQYSDFAVWQRRFLQSERLSNLEAFWKQHLSGAAQIQLPTDHPRPDGWSQRGKRTAIAFPQPLVLDFQVLTNQAQTTLYRSAMAAFNVFLHAYTGQEDFSMGSPVLPRSVNVDGMVGFFVNTVVFRNDLSGDPSFREILSRVHASCRASLQHSDLTLEKVVDSVQPPRDPTRTPLFQVNFRAPKAPLPILHIEGLEIARPVYIDNGTSKFDLSFELEMQTGEGSYIEYRTDLFDPSTVSRMRDDFEDLLREIVRCPDARLSELKSVQAIRQRESNRRNR